MRELKFALSLAQKAGKLASGDANLTAAIKSNKALLVIIAVDAADSSKKDIYHELEKRNVKSYEFLTRAELGSAIGKAPRAAVAVLDPNFVRLILKKIEPRVNPE